MSQGGMATALSRAGEEKRRYPRYRIDLRLRATVRSQEGMKAVHGRGTDLSQAGLCAFLAVDLGIGEIIEIDLTLPYSSQRLKLRALVRHRRSFAYGLQFTDITFAQQIAIERACRSLSITQ